MVLEYLDAAESHDSSHIVRIHAMSDHVRRSAGSERVPGELEVFWNVAYFRTLPKMLLIVDDVMPWYGCGLLFSAIHIGAPSPVGRRGYMRSIYAHIS